MSQQFTNPGLVRVQLRGVLASSCFRDSERHRRLFEFLVESALAGRSDDLKEFTIAAEVWGRDVSFDPRIHSTVRVEVGRLRTRLDRYYAGDGAQDLFKFRIPTGGYAVVFETGDGAAVTPQPETGRFEILEALGRGGMGEIHKARDTQLNRLVALKFIPDEVAHDRVAVERFRTEARAAAAINHPNICTVYDSGYLNGRPFLAMELLEGQTLRHRLHDGSVPLDSFLNWAIQIADGLDAAHKSGIVHRDLKPANLFVTTRDQAKILDFGLAELRDSAADAPAATNQSGKPDANTVAGTLGYMSPEQTRGEQVDSRSDLFALGAVFYEVVTGRPAFSEPSAAETHRAILEKCPPAPSSVRAALPPEVDRIILKALEKDRELRYQNAADLRADLKRVKRDSDSQRSGPSAYAAPLSIPIGKNEATSRRRRTIAAIAAVALLAATGWWVWRRGHDRNLSGDNRVVLAEFSNSTGDAVFDVALRQGLSAQLEQSPFLGLISDARIAQTMQLMAQPKGARLTPELARQVCQRTGSAATIEGSIASLGSQYVLGLRALNCKSGEVLAEVQETADRKELVLQALGRAATSLRRKLGESLPSVEKYDVQPENVTTGSLDALEAYGLGVQAQSRGDGAGAIAHYQRAIALDPDFAMAYAKLGVVLNGNAKSVEYTRKAYTYRDRVSDLERFYLISHYQQYATGNLDEARKTLELWAQTYPHDGNPPGNLFKVYFALGDYGAALSVVQGMIQNSPGTPQLNASRLATALIMVNRIDEAKAVLKDAAARHYDLPDQHFFMYEIDFLQNDAAGMEREAAYLLAQPGWENNTLEIESFSAASGGQMARARDLNERATEAARRAHSDDDTAGFLAEIAVEEALAGNKAVAAKKAREALSLSNGPDVEHLAGMAEALAGDASEADRVINDLNKRYPEDTVAQLLIATMRAGVLLGSGKAPDGARHAVEVLAPFTPYELNSELYLIPIYLRGQAYLAMGQSTEARIEFQKILDQPGITRNFITGSLARLGLADAEAHAGNKAKARADYSTFLALWHDADPDLPLLKTARASLQSLGN